MEKNISIYFSQTYKEISDVIDFLKTAKQRGFKSVKIYNEDTEIRILLTTKDFDYGEQIYYFGEKEFSERKKRKHIN